MKSAGDVLRHAVKRAGWAARWFTREFLFIATRPSPAGVLTSAARLIGLGTVLSIFYVCLSGGMSAKTPQAISYCVISVLLAVLIGNLAKECVVMAGVRVLAACGLDFARRGVTLDGKRYCETFYADGGWIRCESGPAGTVCEWTDETGACNRIVSGPRTRRRD